jgi:hypothetical protein
MGREGGGHRGFALTDRDAAPRASTAADARRRPGPPLRPRTSPSWSFLPVAGELAQPRPQSSELVLEDPLPVEQLLSIAIVGCRFGIPVPPRPAAPPGPRRCPTAVSPARSAAASAASSSEPPGRRTPTEPGPARAEATAGHGSLSHGSASVSSGHGDASFHRRPSSAGDVRCRCQGAGSSGERRLSISRW